MGVEIVRAGPLVMAAFTVGELGVSAATRAAGDPREARPRRALEVLEATRAAAILDGPMYGGCSPSSSSCARVEYAVRDRARGIDIASAHRTRGATVAVVREGLALRARVSDGGIPPAEADVAVQGYPTLLRRGEVVASAEHNTEDVWRAGLAVLADGRVAFALMTGTMRAFADALREAGATEGVYTDGGGSARLALDQGVYAGATEDRAVPVWLTAAAAPPALVAVPVEQGSSAGAALGVFLAIAGALAAKARRR